MTVSPASPETTKRAKIILFFTIFTAMLGLSVLFPIIAPLSRELGLTAVQAGWFSTAYSLMQLIFSPVWGARSERQGRKPVLLLGLVGFALSFGLFGVFAQMGMSGALSGTVLFGLLVASRLIGGILSSATLPTAQAMMADLSTESDRAGAMGLIGAAFGLGVVFGPALGGFLSGFGLVTPVYFSAALGLLTAVAAYFALPETRRAEERAAAGKVDAAAVRRQLLSSQGVMAFLVISALYTMASVLMEQTIAFFVGDVLKLEPQQTAKTVGLMLAFFGLLSAAVQGGAMRRLGKTVPLSRLIPAGMLVMGLGMLLIPLMGSFWSITAALCVVGVGTAILGPSLSTALSLSAGRDGQGAVAGLNSSALALGRMAGPLVGTALYQHVTWNAPYYFSGGLLLALLAVTALVRPPFPSNVQSEVGASA
ncbi:MFS transporter [Deinococcus piscis]|uniref:MFS transporter n=1 Tax=Deinococcus piscis TaxID=394230 RepID=A0ABQ3K989_9DEIO|nr:MFS transporter [Deinococcus piscis]GHG09057.1 MFS transporter [Deinococcus piscis]